MKNKGELFVISGPSGVGKGVICKALLLADDKIRFSVSATTRAPRPGEEHGVSYFFVTREEFEGMIQRNELLEYMDVFGMNYYGTPKAYIEKLTSEGIDVILDIDVNGARNVKKQRPEAVSIFILPPSMQALHSRLVGRNHQPHPKLFFMFFHFRTCRYLFLHPVKETIRCTIRHLLSYVFKIKFFLHSILNY